MSDLPKQLREYRVKLIPAADTGPQPTYPKDLGLRTKFGGLPTGIQERDEDMGETCPRCNVPMHFVGQIDSFEFDCNDNPHGRPYGEAHFMFADVGMIYVWYCFKCMQPLATEQSY